MYEGLVYRPEHEKQPLRAEVGTETAIPTGVERRQLGTDQSVDC